MAQSIIETAAPLVDSLKKTTSPSGSAEEPVTNAAVSNGHTEESNGHGGESPSLGARTPLKLSGALDHFKSFDVTPVIGREFPAANLADWLRAPNSDELLRDLAVTGQEALRRAIFFSVVRCTHLA